MASRSSKLALAAVALAALAGGGGWAWHESEQACCEALVKPGQTTQPQPMGLMTSLPLYWPAGADMAALTSGGAEPPWQRAAIQAHAIITPLDTLSPIPGLSPDEPESDPLEGLRRLAIIQPRGLSPADNVALDEWVRAGGRLLLVLDPMLTGDYPFALGDPRRPADVALIPPVVARWGLEMRFDENAGPARTVDLGAGGLTVELAGTLSLIDGRSECEIRSEGVIGICRVGAGLVTVLADAAVFEGSAATPQKMAGIAALMGLSFENDRFGNM